MTLVASETGGARWVRLVVEGDYVYQGKLVDLTREDLVEIVTETIRWISDTRAITPIDSTTHYYPPLLKEHARDGARWGSVVDFEVRDGDAELAELWGKLSPHPEIVWGIESKIYVYVSIKIKWGYTSAEGVTYGAIVEEVSLTGTPYFKNIGTLQDHWGISCSETLAQELVLLASDTQGDGMAMTDVEKQQLAAARTEASDAKAKAEALEQRLAVLEASDKDKTPEVPAAPKVKVEEAPAWVTDIKTGLNDLKGKVELIMASDTGPTTTGGQPPARRQQKTLKELVKEIQASEGCDEERAWELSAERYPDVMG
jgi:hypothetical protein